MSLKPVTDPTPDQLYCTADDVAAYFDKFKSFDEDTNPPLVQVQKRILSESNWVDSYTGHAWRERRMEDVYHDFDGLYRTRQGLPVSLQKRDIRTPPDPDKGDSFEVWRGNRYDDLVADEEFEFGRDGDFWIDTSRGILYIYTRYSMFPDQNELRISYRFGKENTPQIIQDSVARRVAAYFLETQQFRITSPSNDDAPDASQVAETWREQSERDLDEFVELRNIGV